MNKIQLSSKTHKLIDSALEHIFEVIKGQALGPQSVGKKLYPGYSETLSLAGLYKQAAAMEGINPDTQTIENLTKIAANYLDSVKHKTKAQIISNVESQLKNLNNPNVDPNEIFGIIYEELYKVWGSTGYEVQRIIATEAQKFKAISALEGIIKVNTLLGIQDPTVFFRTARDNKVCEECERLHLLPNKITPRAWKLSQISHDYHKKGSDVPSVMDQHPNGRCSLETLLPGYGFSASGDVEWKQDNWDEYYIQQQLAKFF